MKLSAVLDANAVVGLAKGGVFGTLASLYDPLWIPPAVTQEVLGSTARAGAAELRAALGSWITEATAPSPLPAPAAPLSVADREVLTLALFLRPDHLLSDDRAVCREAVALGLVPLRTPLVVVLMRQERLIPAVRPVLDRMRAAGFGIADAPYRQALAAVGE